MSRERAAVDPLTATLRVARPTNDLDGVRRFYVDGLGLSIIGQFENHDGFDGLMVGQPGAPFHLEFTHERGVTIAHSPTPEHLLVLYYPQASLYCAVKQRMEAAGQRGVSAHNPYWDAKGCTFEDPEGYRIVLFNGPSPV